MPERVYVIVVNYGGADDVLTCLASLGSSTYLDATPVIVENGSTDDSLRRFRHEIPGTLVLDTGRNLGFGAGANLGIQYALDHGGGYIWLLNPDTIVEPDALGAMLATFHQQPDAGIVGSRVIRGGTDPPRIWADGGIIDWDRGAATSHRNVGRLADDVADLGLRRVDYATGASMLVRRSVFDEIGLLPERYFLYFEETDFNVQARSAGWDVLLDPRSLVIHNQRSHSMLPTPHYVYYFVRNRILFGARFTGASVDELERYAREWADEWRRKVADRAPGWLGTFDQLVESAIEDARTGREGQRSDISSVPHPGAARDG